MERLRLSRWLGKLPPRLVWASFVFVNGFLSVAVLAGLALVSHTPFVFPSVGPTAFMLYFTPLAPTASPRNTLCGHAIGIACGFASLWSVGLEHTPSAILEDFTGGASWPLPSPLQRAGHSWFFSAWYMLQRRPRRSSSPLALSRHPLTWASSSWR